MKNKILDSEKSEAIEWFKKYCPKGSTIYTILRSVSGSGMSRSIGLVVISKSDGGESVVFHPNYSASKLLGFTQDRKNDGVKVYGCGMDMGFHLVYSLSQSVYGDGYALKQRWL